jgi:hypothetical protein
MCKGGLLALVFGLFLLSGGLVGQDKKEEPKKVDSKVQDKKDEPTPKLKGVLPANWKKLGLTDSQVQEIYKVQGKYNSEIEKLEAKIAELKTKRDKELKEVLTPEQKKRLDDILTGKEK